MINDHLIKSDNLSIIQEMGAFYLKSEPEWKSGSSQACTEMSGQSQKSAVLISEAIASIFSLAQICIISNFEGRLRSEPRSA